MTVLALELPTPASETTGRWSCRIAMFSVAILICGASMHRFASLPTPVALNLFKAAFAGALLGLAAGLLALLLVWRDGGSGAAPAVFAMILGLAVFAWPGFYVPIYLSLPEINDISTDIKDPPAFTVLAKARAPGTNSAAYPGETFARRQAGAYPDLRTFPVDRLAPEAYELALDALYRLKMDVVREEPPDGGQPGYIEAHEKTLILGFSDDVVVRISGDGRRARVDVRSASRYGRHDLGQNASRIRKILRELQVRLESTVPGSLRPILRPRGPGDKTALPKRDKSGLPASGAGGSVRDRARPDARRGQGQKTKPR